MPPYSFEASAAGYPLKILASPAAYRNVGGGHRHGAEECRFSVAFAAVNRTLETGDAITEAFETTGRTPDGTVVSRFKVTWSFKKRSAK